MQMRKLAFYEFGCRNILYLMFESFSIYYLYQKRLAEAICHSEIVKPNILLRKLKQRKKIKEKKVCVCVWNTSVKMADGGKICRHPNLRLIYGTLWAMNLFYTKCTISKFRNSITVLKLLKPLSKFSARPSDDSNLVFESLPAAATCSLVLLVKCSSLNFSAQKFCFFLVFLSLIYKCAGLSINRAEWLHETSWLGQPSWIVFQKRASTAKRASSLSAYLTSEKISTEFTTDCRVVFKMMQNSAQSYR